MINQVVPPDSLLATLLYNPDQDQRIRIIQHVLLWLVLGGFFGYQEVVFVRSLGGGWQAQILHGANFLVVIGAYYGFAYLALPNLYRRRWGWFIGYTGIIYVFITLCNYAAYSTIAHEFGIMKRAAAPYLEAGWLGSVFNLQVLNSNWGLTIHAILLPVSIKFFKDIMESKNKMLQLQRSNLQLELNFLKAQIQPHFIFNSINSVYSVMPKDGVAAEALLSLSDLLRYSFHESGNELVPLALEADFLKEYVNMEIMRQHERTAITYRHDGPLSAFQIPPMILITFIENAFKHGVNATVRATWVDIALLVEDDGLMHFTVENAKAPPNPLRTKTKGGIGLYNTKRRLHLLFPNAHQLLIQETDMTYSVQLTLELTKYEKPAYLYHY